MKVLLVQPLDDGGIAHYTHNLAEALGGLGQEVHLYTSGNYELSGQARGYNIHPIMFRVASALVRSHQWLARECGFSAVVRRGLKLLEYPWNILECAWTARRIGADVVHFQTVNLVEILMVILMKAIKLKVAFTVHNVSPRHGEIRRHHLIMYQVLYNLCDAVIIHTLQGKNELQQLYSVAAAKISVIPHGDYKFFVGPEQLPAKRAREMFGLTMESKVILFFGAIRPNKGLDVLIRALPIVRSRVPQAKLLVCGEPCENYQRYRGIASEEDVTSMIIEQLGYLPNDAVQTAFTAADIVVLPYREITQSGVLQVAYAFGKPVVATDVGGFPESVEAGVNGFLVPPCDAVALAEAVASILGNPGRMALMGNRSRQLSDSTYSWQTIAEKTISVYAVKSRTGN